MTNMLNSVQDYSTRVDLLQKNQNLQQKQQDMIDELSQMNSIVNPSTEQLEHASLLRRKIIDNEKAIKANTDAIAKISVTEDVAEAALQAKKDNLVSSANDFIKKAPQELKGFATTAIDFLR